MAYLLFQKALQGVPSGWRFAAVALLLPALLRTDLAIAQTTQPLIPPGTPSTDAGQLEQNLERPLTEELTVPSPVLESDDRQEVPSNVEELELKLKQIVVEGSTVYEMSDLDHLWNDYIGRERVSLGKVYEIVNKLTAKYRNDGYILSRAILPPQTINDGNVRIQVVEGYIAEVRVEGELPKQRGLIDIYAKKITESRPTSIKDLERYLLLLRDLPGIESRAIISPAKDIPGASNLDVIVEFDKADGFFRFDNRGSKFNGPELVWLGTGINIMSNYHQRVALTIAGAGQDAREMKYIDLGFQHFLGTEGKSLYVNLTNTDSKPGHILKNLDIRSKAQTYKLGISSPLIRSRTRNLSIYGDFVVRNSETTIFGINRLSKDQIRFISLGALYDSTDRLGGINQIGLQLDQGLKILDASEEGSKELSRIKGQVDYRKLVLTGQRLQSLSGNWSVLANLSAQFASAKLLALEEIGIGGERCVRAYNPSEITGDSGACALLEVRYDRTMNTQSQTGYQLYGFYDAGQLRRISPGSLEKKASLESTGIGVRINHQGWLSSSLEFAWPQKKEVDSRALDIDANRVFFNLTARF